MAATAQAKSKTTKAEYSKETYLFWFESMLLMRKFEEKAGQLYGMQKIRGFCHLYIGQEACASGAVSALRKGDKYITAYRDHAHPFGFARGCGRTFDGCGHYSLPAVDGAATGATPLAAANAAAPLLAGSGVTLSLR